MVILYKNYKMKLIKYSILCIFALSCNLLNASTSASLDSVQFEYCGQARRVSLMSDLLYADEDTARYTDHNRTVKMHRDSDGCFRVTVPPVSPGMYTYCFKVDGHRIPDPNNNDTAWQKLHKWNIYTESGSYMADLCLPPAQWGQVVHTQWYSHKEKQYRRVDIYIPHSLLSSFQREPGGVVPCPVLYLLHGINGYESSWAERGRAIHIMENMIARGECEPAILVMPDCNLHTRADQPSHYSIGNNILHYPRLRCEHKLDHAISDLIDMIDSTYNVQPLCSIAGFSDGARIAANIANLRPDRVSTVGLFSPVINAAQLPKEGNHTYFAIYVGKRDMFYKNGRRFHRRLDKRGCNHNYVELSGGHTWRIWRECLANFLLKDK